MNSPEIKHECHLCRETVETSQLIHCMRCGMVLCKECDLDHREICATEFVVMKTNLSKEALKELSALVKPNRELEINQIIGTFNRASRSVS